MDGNFQPQDIAQHQEGTQEMTQKSSIPRGGTPYASVRPAGATAGSAEQIRRDERMIYIGKKETMNYVLAVVTQFNNNLPEVHLKARGKMISRAVDVAEIVRNRFMPNVKVRDIQISTEELTSEDGSRSKVSSIEIVLAR